jgi:small subunit ribosomal protein S6
MDLRRYETLILLSPQLNAEQVEAFKQKMERVLAAGGGQILRFEEWGRRRLAYPVHKETHGYYVLWDYKAEPALMSEFQRNCKIDEQVFKYLTVSVDKEFEELQAAEGQGPEPAGQSAEGGSPEPAEQAAEGGSPEPAGQAAEGGAPGSDETAEADDETAPQNPADETAATN